MAGDGNWSLVRSCIRAFEAGDMAAILDAQVLAAARLLAAGARSDEAVLRTLGDFYYCRSRALPEGEGRPHLLEACYFYLPLYRGVPGSCPPELLCVMMALAADPAARYDRDARSFLNDAGADFLTVTEQTGDTRGAEAACACLQAAAGAAPDDDPDRPIYLANLAMALLTRFEELGDQADIDAAVEAAQAAADLAQHGAGEMGRYWSGLAGTLTARAAAYGDSADLERAIACGRAATAATGRDDPRYAGRMDNLAAALIDWCQLTGEISDVEAALAAAARAVAATGQDDPAMAERLSKVAVALSVRFELAGDPGDLDEAVALQRRAVTVIADTSPGKTTMLSNLAAILAMRFERDGQLADLDDAIDAGRRALRDLPAGHGARPSALHNLAACLTGRGEITGSVADLEEAVAASSAAQDLLPPGHADWHAVASSRGNAHLARYEQTGNAADLEQAARTFADVLARSSANHPDYAGWLANYANARLHLFGRSGALDDVDEAISSYRRALHEIPPASPERAAMLENLAAGYRQRALVTGQTGDLDQAVAAAEELLEFLPEEHVRRAPALAGLSQALRLRSDQTGSMADADRAVTIAEHATQAAADARLDPVACADRFAGLAKALLTRFDRTGSLTDADGAVTAAGQAADLVSAHPDQIICAARTTDLANALLTRGSCTGSSADSARAIELIQAAVRKIPPGHPSYPGRLVNLANVLLESAEHADPAAGEDGSDPAQEMDAAVEASGVGMRLMPPAHQEWWMAASAHGNALLARFQQVGNLTDLSAGIAAYRQALAALSAGHPDRAGQLANLGIALRLRFEATGQHDDLACAADHLRAAVRGIDGRRPDSARCQLAYGQVLIARFPDTGTAATLAEAVRNLRAAASNTAAQAAVRLAAAAAWGAAAAQAQRWDLAAEGSAAAVGLLPLAAWHGLSRRDRERQLASWPGIARDAAACALQAGRPEMAVEILEHGRAVVWGQILQTRSDLTELAASHPVLAARMAQIRRILDQPESGTPRNADGPSIVTGLPGARWRSGEHRMRAAREWDTLLEQVRALPGFRDFGRPVPFAQLAKAADSGPVVIINVSRIRCDALIITGSGLRALPLGALTWDSVIEHGDAYLRAIQRLTGYGDDDLSGPELASRLGAIDAALSWLWTAIAEPVLADLGHAHPPDPGRAWPRIWWSPTGPLSMLPIHAAGHHARADAHENASVMDRVVSSYTPTLSALIRARHSHSGKPAGRRLLVMAMPAAPAGSGLPCLPGAVTEASWLAARFAGSCTRRDDERATVGEALRLIPRHEVAHFTCHGSHDLARPSQSGLLLSDGVLSLPEIAALDLGQAELAFLSACHTAIGGVRLLDEAAHLSAAFQLAGYRHVIGTLWAVADRVTATAVADIYEELSGGPGGSLDTLDAGRAALALHRAVRNLRDRHRAFSLRWLPYVHIGP